MSSLILGTSLGEYLRAKDTSVGLNDQRHYISVTSFYLLDQMISRYGFPQETILTIMFGYQRRTYGFF